MSELDLISRQDVIDAFGLSEKTRKYGGDHSGYETIMLYEVQDIIEQLPSVNPKPCGDLISRQAAIDALYDWSEHSMTDGEAWHIRQVIGDIKSMPSAQSEQQWIPVSERLPKKSGNYWCTFGGTNLTGSDYYTTESDVKEIFDEPEEYTGWRSQNVIAWMPLPQPYEPQESEVEK